MPYAKTSSGYPASIRALLEEVAADNLARRVHFTRPSEARGQRARLYAYLAAIKRDLRNKPEWLTSEAQADLAEFLRRAMTLEFVVSGTDLIVRPRDQSPVAEAFRNATIEAADPQSAAATPSDASASLVSLLSKIKEQP